jgi:DNA modification methylase
MLEINKIYNMDNVEGLKLLDDCSVDLTVTSPPYDNLREYKGFSFDFENVAKQLYRVTKNGGVVVWVVNDTTCKFRESLSSFKQILYFVDTCGFGLLDTMIFAKKDYPPPYPSLKRYANQFEFMFVLSKGRPKTFNPIQIDKIGLGEGKKAFRKSNGELRRKDVKDNGKKTKPASNLWFYQVGGGNGYDHPAIFPEKLANDHIVSWSNEGDIVLDPFMGSGTTAKMSILNKRNYIGFEIAKEYYEMSLSRLLPYTEPTFSVNSTDIYTTINR